MEKPSAIVKKYLHDVTQRNISANEFVRGYAEETLAEIDRWDLSKVDNFGAWAEKLEQTTGSRAGQTLQLLPWQLLVAAQLLCDPDCKSLLVVVARGAGKTELAGALLTYAMLTEGTRQQFFAVAPKLSAAHIVFDRTRTMVRHLDPTAEASDSMAQSTTGGWIRANGSTMRALPCTPTAMDGLAARLVIADEVARMDSAFSRVLTGLAKDPAAQLLAITTPDANQKLQPIWPYWTALLAHYGAVKGATQAERPDGWRGMFFGLDPEDDATDESTYIKAQPSLGVTVTAKGMATQVAAMMGTHDPEQVAECDMQLLCRHNDRLAGSVDLAILDRQMATPIDWASLKGSVAVAAVDLAKGGYGKHLNLTSACLAVWDSKNTRFCYQLVHWWAGTNIEADEKLSQQPLRAWIASGALRQMPSETHDLAFVESQLQAWKGQYQLRHVGVDPLAHQQSALIDWQKRGISVKTVDQGIRTMGPAWALWVDGLRGRRVFHQPDDVLREALKSTKVITDNAGNTRPVKGRSPANIDAVIASCMAAFLCEQFQVSMVSNYEGGTLVL
jgi:phage terminase large subunit-like protein